MTKYGADIYIYNGETSVAAIILGISGNLKYQNALSLPDILLTNSLLKSYENYLF